jgi:hypothetical protein
MEEYLRRKIMGIEQGYRASQGEAKITKVHYGSSVRAGGQFQGVVARITSRQQGRRPLEIQSVPQSAAIPEMQ